jgi:hypothetical protein
VSERVVEITAADLVWPFDGRGEPRAMCPRAERVDPFPCYPHDIRLVKRTLRDVERAVSIELAPQTIFVLHHEPLARTNGWAESDTSWNEETEKWDPSPGWITLAGKRIPPHPAVTRYLVAHEYGHHVEYDLLRRRGRQPHERAVANEYAELRKLPDGHHAYGGGRWHSNVSELLANDFRILVAGVEPEFWPHPGYPRPERVKGLKAWWREALA